jgi:hypothetical protein
MNLCDILDTGSGRTQVVRVGLLELLWKSNVLAKGLAPIGKARMK